MAAVTAAVGSTALGGTAIQPAAAGASSVGDCDAQSVGQLVFYETSSLLDENYDRLEDDDIVFVYSEPTASAGEYDDEPVPLWARDGNYFGSGGLLVQDDEDNCLDYGQDAVLLNIIDSYTGGSGHIVYDESADQASNYSLDGEFSKFKTWVQDEGYTIEASEDLTDDLDGADALLITLPNDEHDDEAVDAIEDFASAGNPVFLFNEADSWDTDDLNYLAWQLDLAFRFAEDEVEDEPGWEWDDWPITRNYDDDTYPEWFEYRPSMGFDPGEIYEAEIVNVIDGDTFDVEFVGGFHDGEEDIIRHLGQDTPEAASVGNDPEEWRGIESENYLDTWGSNATDYAESHFDEGDRITFWVDEKEFPPRGLYGRLLAFHTFPEGHPQEDDVYNLDVVEKGYAKPYNSAFEDHPEYVEAYWDAYEQGLRVWEESDAEATDEIWNRDVEALRFRGATPIANAGDEETAVWSGTGDPLVGVDEDAGIALVGGLMNADNWESDDDENFVFNANLAQQLSGDVDEEMLMIEGGHGQFAASYDFSFEGKEAYHRYIEGLDAMWFQAVNDLSEDTLDVDEGRHALVITPPDVGFCYTADEVDALKSYLDDGGAIVLKANTEVEPESVEILNDLAAELGTDLQFGGDGLGDVETSNFDESFDLFEAYDTDTAPGDDPADFTVSIDDYDGEVDEGEDVTVAYTVENVGEESDTQDIVFEVDGDEEDREENVSLGENGTFSDSFTYTTADGDAPEITVAVSTDDDAEQRDVVVEGDDDDEDAEADLEADPDAENEESEHTWTVDASEEFDGEADEITVDYPSGTSLDGLTNEDVTVYLDRDGDGELDEISVNSDEYAGSEATFDLDGRFNTSVEGELSVEIDGVENPDAGEYEATIELDGEDFSDADAEFVVEGEDDGESDPVIDGFDVSTSTSGPWFNVDNDWEVSDDDGNLDTVVTELLDGGTVVDSESSNVSGSSASGEHELRTRDDANEVRMTVTDEDGNETSETKAV